jgi:hypothetical protein
VLELVGEIDQMLTPMDYALAVMRDPSVDPHRRDRMAVALMPFMHQRLGEDGKKAKAKVAAELATTGPGQAAEIH